MPILRTLRASPPFGELRALAAAASTDDPALRDAVAAILRDVRARGDAALLEYTARFDGFDAGSAAGLRIGADRLEEAAASADPELLASLRRAAENIRRFHEKQREHGFLDLEPDGTLLGQRVAPLRRVGIYVPGGRAAYPSSVLMNAIPAAVAGVDEIAMATPAPGGEVLPVVLAAAHVAGGTEVLRIGGAQAVAARAFGTETIGRVDKIVGPGNRWVAEGKRQVFGAVDIDMVAGPSEILVVTDGHAPADWLAMDLFSQAEHDEVAQAILLCPNAGYLDEIERSIARLLPEMSRRDIIAASLGARGALVLTRDLEEACEVASRIAPEHLELVVEAPDTWVPKIRNAGAIFLGRWSSEAIGDYCAGPNHVLPTAGTARFSSPLGVYDFQKRTSIIEVSQGAAAELGRIAGTLADGEGFAAHARAARMRFDGNSN